MIRYDLKCANGDEFEAWFGSIADYDAVFDPIRQRRQEASGRQAGDPVRAALAVLELIESASPPRHLVLGNDALLLLHNASKERADERAAWEHISRSTGHD